MSPARLEPPRLDPVAVERRRRHRPADDPHVRPDAARGDRRLHLDHRSPLRQPRRRLGSHLPLRRLGRRRRHRRRAALPPRDELERGARPVVGAVRDLEGRPRRLGRHRGRLPRRWLHREARRRRRVAARRLPRTRTARRPGGRADRQLVEPGALRQADRPAVGPRDRPGPPAARARSTRRPTTRRFSTRLLWNLLAALVLVYVIERRFHPRPPGLFALYIALYSFGRFWIELVRVDPANHILGLRVNTWVSGLVFVAGIVWFYLSQRASEAEEDSPRRRRGRR